MYNLQEALLCFSIEMPPGHLRAFPSMMECLPTTARLDKIMLNSIREHRDLDMFAEYIQAALKRAEYKPLEDGTYMATVEGLRGVIAIGDTVEECRQDLIEVIDGWVALRLRMGDTIPPIGGVSIDVSMEPMAIV